MRNWLPQPVECNSQQLQEIPSLLVYLRSEWSSHPLIYWHISVTPFSMRPCSRFLVVSFVAFLQICIISWAFPSHSNKISTLFSGILHVWAPVHFLAWIFLPTTRKLSSSTAAWLGYQWLKYVIDTIRSCRARPFKILIKYEVRHIFMKCITLIMYAFLFPAPFSLH